MTRPLSVTVVAIVAGVIGALYLAASLIGILGTAAEVGFDDFPVGTVVGLLLTDVPAVAALAMAVGAWRLRPWSWALGMVLALAWLAFNAWQLITSGELGTVAVSIALNVALLVLLLLPSTRTALQRPS